MSIAENGGATKGTILSYDQDETIPFVAPWFSSYSFGLFIEINDDLWTKLVNSPFKNPTAACKKNHDQIRTPPLKKTGSDVTKTI